MITIDIITDFLEIDDFEYDGKVIESSIEFKRFFKENIVQTYQNNEKLTGLDINNIRSKVLQYGKTNFDKGELIESLEILPEDKFLAYCYWNLRIHFYSFISILNLFLPDFELNYFLKKFSHENKSILFFDFGCGPMTSFLALNDFYLTHFHKKPVIKYFGIDTSISMLKNSIIFRESQLFNVLSSFEMENKIENINIKDLDLDDDLILCNFSYFFFNLDNEEEIVQISSFVEDLEKFYYESPIGIIYQNPSRKCKQFDTFKSKLKSFKVVSGGDEKIVYRNNGVDEEKPLDFRYELLGNLTLFKSLGKFKSNHAVKFI